MRDAPAGPAAALRSPDATADDRRREDALFRLGRWLAEHRYQFTAITPASHARVVRRKALARDLRDVFGWSLPFEPTLLSADLRTLVDDAGALHALPDGRLRSGVRYATLGAQLFVHSAWPTVEPDAVFFGPDTYRFVHYLRRHLPRQWPAPPRIADVGCGSGAGGLLAARWLEDAAPRLHLLDINPRALAHARVNARLAGLEGVEVARSDLLQGLAPSPDLVICNPPYLPDAAGRAYRDGGALLGSALSLRLLREAIPRLRPGGWLLLYTGTAVIDGQPVFEREALALLRELAATRPLHYAYEELDPDVFGEELEEPALRAAERIAVVGLSVQVRAT